VVLKYAEEKVSSDLEIKKFIELWDKIRKQTWYILAFSLN